MANKTIDALRELEGMSQQDQFRLLGWLCAENAEAVLKAVEGMRAYDDAKKREQEENAARQTHLF